ncbi:hypothetical protein F2Q70_00015351 [Brassica cretica]|uniref:Uncharacterized protein n=1 Tax=Brassica cretica TaxID=69181 RepID=A0A8S9I1Y6_BRACR|nr:hypothetical protein F2Q70_00015351 [Brassica cretica]
MFLFCGKERKTGETEARARGRVRGRSGRVVGYGSGRRVSGQEIIPGRSCSDFGTSLPYPAPNSITFWISTCDSLGPLRLPALNRRPNLRVVARRPDPAASPRSKLDYKLCFDARVPNLAASPRAEPSTDSVVTERLQHPAAITPRQLRPPFF